MGIEGLDWFPIQAVWNTQHGIIKSKGCHGCDLSSGFAISLLAADALARYNQHIIKYN